MQCSYCEQVFESQIGKLYCSEDCRHRAKKSRRRQKANRQFSCEQCWTTFWRNSDRGRTYRFCSVKCAADALRKPAAEPFRKVCVGCQQEFTTFREHQKFCSVTCSTQKTCLTCGQEFIISTSERLKHRRYCSKRCWPNPSAHSTGNIVYFLLAVGLQRVKVGFSGEFVDRLDAIRRQEADDIEVLGTVPGDQNLERIIHSELDALAVRAHHEWFDFRPQAVKDTVNRYLYPVEGDPNVVPSEGCTDSPQEVFTQ